jgi:hypothetical protein
VKFWRVVEPVTRMFEKVPRPLEVKLPPILVVKYRLVEEAVPLKKADEVALVEEALRAVKLPTVVEPKE